MLSDVAAATSNSTGFRDGGGGCGLVNHELRRKTLRYRGWRGISDMRIAAASRAIAKISIGGGSRRAASLGGGFSTAVPFPVASTVTTVADAEAAAQRRSPSGADQSVPERSATDPRLVELFDQMADAHAISLCAILAVPAVGDRVPSRDVNLALHHALSLYSWLYGPLSRQVMVTVLPPLPPLPPPLLGPALKCVGG
jgi:hypothetical protein